MAMQHTPLLMSNILDRGARVAPDEEIVTATESGVRRQTYKETRDRAHQLAHALNDAGIVHTRELLEELGFDPAPLYDAGVIAG